MFKITTLLVLLAASVVYGESGPAEKPLPAKVSWFGNTFGGAADRWVQNYIDEIEVAPDGTIFTASTWDENGRVAGIYTPDGDVWPGKLKQYGGRGGHKAWGSGTAGQAVAIDDDHIYLTNTAKELLKFDRANRRYVETIKDVGKILGMTHAGGRLYLAADDGTVQVLDADKMSLVHSFPMAGVRDLVMDRGGHLWALAGEKIVELTPQGEPTGRSIDGVPQASAVALAHDGQLIVTDRGPRQQVLFYDIASDTPRRARTFGVEGGLAASEPTPPGVPTPHKLFNLAGAATDAKGNLYLACSGGIWDGTTLRKFTPDGKMEWELLGLLYVDTPAVDPDGDGNIVYSGEERFVLDPDAQPGKDWKLAGYTLDPTEADPLKTDAHMSPAFARRVDGRVILYYTNQHAVPVHLRVKESGDSEFFRPAGEVKRPIADAWGMYADARGDLWFAGKQQVAHVPLTGFDAGGHPRFGEAKIEAAPPPFTELQRIIYDRAGDTMYLAGYTADKKKETWGLVGKVLARYDNWSRTPAHERKASWTIDLPHVRDNKLPEPAQPYMKSVDIAGDYVFLVGVKTRAKVWVYGASDGSFVGHLLPDDTVGGINVTGWIDTPHGIAAARRKNGEYVVLVEEDYRAKTLVYRWRPDDQ